MDTRERCVPMYVRSHVHMVVHGPHTRTQCVAQARRHALKLMRARMRSSCSLRLVPLCRRWCHWQRCTVRCTSCRPM